MDFGSQVAWDRNGASCITREVVCGIPLLQEKRHAIKVKTLRANIKSPPGMRKRIASAELARLESIQPERINLGRALIKMGARTRGMEENGAWN